MLAMESTLCMFSSNFVTPSMVQIRNKTQNPNNTITNLIPKSSMVQTPSTNIPKSFIWSIKDDIGKPKEIINAPIIDLEGFIRGDEMATNRVVEVLKVACSKHGFFQVINHGIEPQLINDAFDNMGHFFNLPPTQKARALKKPGNPWGLSVAHSDRWTSNLPWKEMLSFPHNAKNKNNSSVADYFTLVMGAEFEPMGKIYQKYCDEMHNLSLAIIELLAISLGIDRSYYRDFFQDANSIMRLNSYPPCDEPNLVLGTGPHCDPTSLTVLYQNQVGGLQVFVDNKWKLVEPLEDAFVINIGDTFMAMTNGEYKSCLHRAVVNEKEERKTMTFFLCPQEDKVVRPPDNLNNKRRKYPDFTWSQFFGFSQKHYWADHNILQSFTDNLWSKLLISDDSENLINKEFK